MILQQIPLSMDPGLMNRRFCTSAQATKTPQLQTKLGGVSLCQEMDSDNIHTPYFSLANLV